ncbi:hypothetical protein CRG98_001380 [Punica granatum]|uniref:Uncharacterized protein n=1 Tax=Punica granatum TaxID=22663 RepID=A0A2I0LBZ7_PUNGR|nr:hypothetical protein CRG98_001380 [Punica granatum]
MEAGLLLSIGVEQWCQQREAETSRSTVRGSRARGSRGRVEVAVQGPRVAARGFFFVWSAGLSKGLRLVKMKDEGGHVKVETGWKLKPTAFEILKLGLT